MRQERTDNIVPVLGNKIENDLMKLGSLFTILLCLCILLVIARYAYYYIWSVDEDSSVLPPIQMLLTDSTPWDSYDRVRGYQTDSFSDRKQSLLDSKTCDGFFSIWFGSQNHSTLKESLPFISAQMVAMSSTFTLALMSDSKSTAKSNPSSEIIRTTVYTNIEIVSVDTAELLHWCGYSPSDISTISAWPRLTRTSDVVRICYARRYHKSYLDMDISFLHLDKALYEAPYAAAALWRNNKDAIEISNCAFCLTDQVLLDMTAHQKHRIRQGDDGYFYTELGPSMFHNVIFNKHAVMLLSQNSPIVTQISTIGKEVWKYNHRMLHLSGHIRKAHPSMSYVSLANAIRVSAGLPALPVVVPK